MGFFFKNNTPKKKERVEGVKTGEKFLFRHIVFESSIDWLIILANRQLLLCSESNTYNILEFSLSETYAQKQITAVRPLCVGRVKRRQKGKELK